MVERLAAGAGGVDEDAQILACALLADELVERFWPKCGVGILGGAFWRGQAVGIGGHDGECSHMFALVTSFRRADFCDREGNLTRVMMRSASSTKV
jgi:hypothetical protein